MANPLKILYLEDNPLDAELVKATLQEAGLEFDIVHVGDEGRFRSLIRTQKFDLILADHGLPAFDGAIALSNRQEFCPDTPFIFVSGSVGEARAIDTLKGGATDFVLKSHLSRLVPAVRRALHEAEESKDLQRAETALRESERRYRLLFERNLAAVFSCSIEGEILECNDALARLLGWESHEELNGTRVHDIYVDPADHEEVIRKILAKEIPPNREVQLRCKDGNIVWALASTNVLDSEGDRPVSIQRTLIDITERKRSEDQRRHSEEVLANAQRIAHVGSWEYDLSTHDLTWSDEVYRIFGISPADFEGSNEKFFSHIHPDDRELVKETFQEAVRQGSPYSVDHRIIRLDGSIRVVHEQAELVFDSEGNPVRMSGTVHDITEHTSLENQFRQAQKMEAVGRLAGGVAHDFNNLLTIITGYADLVLTSQMAEDDPNRTFLEEIKRAGERAAGLTRQLLAFSRQQVLHPQVLDLNSVLSGIENMLRRLIGEDVELSTVYTPSPGSVRADPGQIEQVLMNLAVNARDAMPRGGKLIIETRGVYLDETYVSRHTVVRPGEYVLISVSDTGEGMSEETQRLIFEPFFTTKEKGKGTGLGLATVYGIIKQSGGYIWVYSEVGMGSTFKIYLPRTSGSADDLKRVESNLPERRGSETVLLVEDDFAVRQLAQRILRARGYAVLEAKDVNEALALATAPDTHIHLLLTDMVMPNMNGRDLAEKVLAEQPGVRVLFMSGYTQNTITERGLLQDGVAFLQKPFSTDQLLKKVHEVLYGG
jgi:PAS domain S-box-containing protein